MRERREGEKWEKTDRRHQFGALQHWHQSGGKELPSFVCTRFLFFVFYSGSFFFWGFLVAQQRVESTEAEKMSVIASCNRVHTNHCFGTVVLVSSSISHSLPRARARAHARAHTNTRKINGTNNDWESENIATP